MAVVETIPLEAVCGCELLIPVFGWTEPIPGRAFGFRLRIEPAAGKTWDDVERLLAEVCDACVEP